MVEILQVPGVVPQTKQIGGMMEVGRGVAVPESAAPTISAEQTQELGARVFNSVHPGINFNRSQTEVIGRSLAGVGITLGDNVWSSPLNPVGWVSDAAEPGDVWSHMSQANQDFYKDNQSGIDGFAGAAGVLATLLIGDKFVTKGLSTALASSTAITGTRMYQAGKGLTEAATGARVLEAQLEAVRMGERFSMLGTKAGRNFLAAKSAVHVGSAIRQEALVYGVMWNNETINQEGWADDAKWIGVGIGLGVATAAIQARGVLRKGLNSPEARTTAAQNFGLGGMTDVMVSDVNDLSRLDRILPSGKVVEESTDFTVYATAFRENGSLDKPARLQAEVNKQHSLVKEEMEKSLLRINNRGITGIDTFQTKGAIGSEMTHLIETTVKQDPWVLHGVAELGIPTGDYQKAMVARTRKLAEDQERAALLVNSKDAAKGRRLASETARRRKQEPMVLVNNTWVAADSKIAQAASEFNQAVAKTRVILQKDATEVHVNLPGGKGIVLDGSLSIRTTTSAGVGHATRKLNYAAMNPTEQLYVQEGMNKMVNELVRKGDSVRFRVTKRNEGDWLALDLADEILSRGGKINFDEASKVQTHEQLRRAAAKARAKAVLAEVGDAGPIDSQMRIKYNLPEETAMERLEDPDGNVLRRWLDMAASDQGSSRELGDALANARSVSGYELKPVNGLEPAKLNGGMIGWNRNEKGDFMRPLLAYFNPSEQITKISQLGHQESYMVKQAEKMALLTNRTNQSFASRLAREVVMNPAMNIARKVSELIEGQTTGTGNAIKTLLSEVLPQRSLSRDNKTVLAAMSLREEVMRKADFEFADMMKKTGLADLATRLDTPAMAAMTAQLDEFASLRPGWRIAGVEEVEPGWFGFVLDDSQINRELLGVKKVEKGTLMPNLRLNKPIVLQKEAMAVLDSRQAMYEEIRKSTNTILLANGLEPIEQMLYYSPTTNTRDKFVGFIYDENDKLVKMQTVVAATQQEYESAVRRLVGHEGKAGELPNGYTVRSREQLAASGSIFEQAAMNWIDHGFSSATKGIGAQSGGLTGSMTKAGAFKESLEWAKNQIRHQAQEVLETSMSEPIKLARIRNAAQKQVANDGTRTVFDVWENALTGRSVGFRETSVLTEPVRRIEQSIDKVLASQAIHTPAHYVLDIAKRFGVSPSSLSHAKTYRQITEIMGAKSPYANVTELLESKNVKMPITMKGMQTKLNALATNVVLRWDPAMATASMNMIGLIPTLMAGARAGGAPNALSMSIKGRAVPFVDSMMIIKRGMGRMLGKEGTKDFSIMKSNGDASQSAFEYRTALAAVESHAGWKKWANESDKWISAFSDGSENMSRQISHFVGLEMADYMKIKGDDARHLFAREFANAAIADYNPANRPEFFDTAVGGVFGLFQSYVVNQYTKMFRWIEDGQWTAFGTQAAVQASLFGVPSTYGAGHLFDLMQIGAETGEPSLMDAAYQRFGPVMGGALMHGSIAELTQIALWTRGDINIRVPALSGQMPPGVDVIKRFGTMFTGVVKESLNQGPIDALPASIEIIQREMPNRMLKGLLAVIALDGKETDRFGQVMTETRHWTESVIRIAGLRSRRTQQELEVFYANKSDLDRDAARMDKVRRKLRTDVRTAARTDSPINPDDYFEQYVAAGGTPQRYRSWLNQIMSDATTTRSAAQLKRSLEAPRNALQLWRYGGYNAWGIDDGTTKATQP